MALHDMELAYLKILSLKESILSAEERYFLLRIATLFGDRIVDGGVRELERAMNMSPRVFREVRDSLLAKGFLVLPSDEEVDVLRAPKKGRPRICFYLSAAPLAAVGKAMAVKAPHGVGDLVQRIQSSRFEIQVRELLFWGMPGEGEPPSDLARLRPATRLLLATLLGVADHRGVVRDVGLGRLAHLVGMKRDRLEYQLEMLAAEGFIRARFAGLTGKYLFGQVAGAIVLNVGHQAFKASFPQVLVCIEDEPSAQFDGEDFIDGLSVYLRMRSKEGGIRAIKGHPTGSRQPFATSPNDPWDMRRYREQTLAQALRRMEAAAPLAAEVSDGVLHVRTGHDPHEGLLGGESRRMAADLWEQFELSRFFAGSPRQPFDRYLQYKVDEYVGQLLSDHWSEVRSWPGRAVPAVLERIGREIVTQANRDELMAWTPPKSLMEAFSLCLYLIVLRRAYWFKSVLTHDLPIGALGGNPGDCDYVLLPPVYSHPQRLAVLVMPRPPTVASPAHVVAIRRRADLSTQPMWKPAAAEKLADPSAEELKLFWRHPVVRPSVLKGLAARQVESEDDPAHPEE